MNSCCFIHMTVDKENLYCMVEYNGGCEVVIADITYLEDDVCFSF